VIPVIFLKELLNEAFELKPQSNAKAKKSFVFIFSRSNQKLKLFDAVSTSFLV